MSRSPDRTLLFVGSLNREAPYFQGARGKGIAVFSFDEVTGEAEQLSETDDIDNPTFLTLDPSRNTLYAVSEIFGHKEGQVSAYRFDRETGQLSYLNKQASGGSITAYSALSADRRFLLVANYGLGEGGPDYAVASFPIREDGSLGPLSGGVRHIGTGPDSARQERAHAHFIHPMGEDGTVLVADLGLDRIVRYRLNSAGEFARTGETVLPPGSGPRHLAFGANAVFAVNELASTVQSFHRAPDETLEPVSTVSAIPEGVSDNHCSDLHLSGDGRFLYAANRGHDSLAVFAVDPVTAVLSPLGFAPCGGATPRNFALSPSERFILVANQNGDVVSVLPRDAETGMPGAPVNQIGIGTPMCVRLLSL